MVHLPQLMHQPWHVFIRVHTLCILLSFPPNILFLSQDPTPDSPLSHPEAPLGCDSFSDSLCLLRPWHFWELIRISLAWDLSEVLMVGVGDGLWRADHRGNCHLGQIVLLLGLLGLSADRPWNMCVDTNPCVYTCLWMRMILWAGCEA